ncbi:hypothetical protein ACFL29_01705 [Patescibacteria group bacterium]
MFHKQKASEKAFRKIGFGAICISVIVLIVAMYFAISRATIIVEPKQEAITAELLVTVKEAGIEKGDIAGKIGKTAVEKEATFAPSGAGKDVQAQATGEIEIINKHNSGQTLVATTRFLSESGVLFRLQDKVRVPAGGSAIAEVYADKEGKEGEIQPSNFTIPGLSRSLQAKIYGVSKEAMTGGVRKVSMISQEDVEKAVEGMRANLLLEASEKIKAEINSDSEYSHFLFEDRVISRETDKEVGAESDEFSLKLVIEVVGVAYSETLMEQAQTTLDNVVPSDRKLISSNISELAPSIENYDFDSRSANLKVELVGQTVVNEKSSVFDKERLAGKTKEEVQQYLEERIAVKNLEVKFFPFWIKKVPVMKDHIKIIIR